MASAFTARSVATLSLPEGVRQAEYWDASLKNFGLRISYGGLRTWVIRYRVNNGPRQRMTLGLHSTWVLPTPARGRSPPCAPPRSVTTPLPMSKSGGRLRSWPARDRVSRAPPQAGKALEEGRRSGQRTQSRDSSRRRADPLCALGPGRFESL
jgi:hypothetical protein